MSDTLKKVFDLNSKWDVSGAVSADKVVQLRPGKSVNPSGTIIPGMETLKPKPWVWRDPATIPPRPWLYGRHLQRRTCAVTVSPGGIGKTTLAIAELLAMATGREILGEKVPTPLKVWGLFLEEDADELDRRITSAVMHHQIGHAELSNRLFIGGNETRLCLASQTRDGVTVAEPVVETIINYVEEHGIDHITVDPFVKSHRVTENDNNAIDAVATEWARIARECNISIELVHHTRKGNGATLTSEDGRGGSALLNAARDGRVLNKASLEQRQKMGVDTATDLSTYFSVTQDKPNNGVSGKPVWYRTIGYDLGNGDRVATVERFEAPDTFEGITVEDTLRVQQAIAELAEPRASDQSPDWVGNTVASVLGLPMPASKARVKELVKGWLGSGVLNTEKRSAGGAERPYIIVGEWITDI